jgi:quercetin 2,3-dioxygenase
VRDVSRRDALKLIAAAGAAASASCRETIEMKTREPVGADAILRVAPLGSPPWPTRDPFLFCVHHDDRYPAGNAKLGPATSLDGRQMGQDFGGKDGWSMYHGLVVPGFPEHPHRGFETVTVVRRGLVDHSDSLGATARYGDGDVQWLTAGKGIVHAEMFPLLDRAHANHTELFQIWLNLPRTDKMVDPYFSMLWKPSIPKQTLLDDEGRATELAVIAGSYQGMDPAPPPPSSWAAKADHDVAIWTIKLAPRARWMLPAARPGTNRTLYFFQGAELIAGGRRLGSNQQIDLRADLSISLEAGADETEVLLLQGRPIAEPVVQYGPFVMNTRQEIQQAFMDYQRTQFGGWPWTSNDPVHPREQGRFARHADGKIESPSKT